MLGIDAWMHAATLGDDWVVALRESARALNARSIVLIGADGAGGLTTYSAERQMSREFVRFCEAAPAEDSTAVLSQTEG